MPTIELVTTRPELDAVVKSWVETDAPDSERRVGLVLLMENADPVRFPRLEDTLIERRATLDVLGQERDVVDASTSTTPPSRLG